MQDLTPQLRTRLGRVERAVGVFVLLATLLLLAGFCYYIYHTAKRKGWFDTKVTYYTLTYSAAGLKVGDPVKLMGFDVGEITRIEGQPPDDLFNVYVEFEIKAPYFGYLWTEGSRARVTAADFLGNRFIEVTKGSNYRPTHLVWEVRQYAPAEALRLSNLRTNLFLDEIPSGDTNPPLAMVLQPLSQDALEAIAAAGIETVRVADRSTPRKQVTAAWNFRTGTYEAYTPHSEPYWLPPEESAALTERLQTVVEQAERVLTNQLVGLLASTTLVTSNASELLVRAQPLLTNLAAIATHLSDPAGSLGQWLIPADLRGQLQLTLTNANTALTDVSLALTNTSATMTNANAILLAANTNLASLVAQLSPPLDQLSLIVSNLNTQVQANTNFLAELSSLVRTTDELLSGLKRHWLLRGAFKDSAGQPSTPAKPPPPARWPSLGPTDRRW